LNEIPANNHINSHYQLIFSLFLKPKKATKFGARASKNKVPMSNKESFNHSLLLAFVLSLGGGELWELGILEAIFKNLGTKNRTIIQSIHIRHHPSLSYP
jgi:hypothetical protein